MRKEICLKNNKNSVDDFWVLNCESEKKVSNTRFSSLLTSKDRDFLLSPTGNQVLSLSLSLSLSLYHVKVSNIEGKVVGLYFSANWYPPCRKFTPVLASVYEQLKGNGIGFEVVFVSSDEDSEAFNSYRACMPWLAIPFSDLATKKALNQRFDIEGIPCLIILQPNDNATLREGVELIYRYGVRAFPFTKERLEELEKEEREKHESQTLTNLLTNHTRDFLLGHPSHKQVPVASLVGKTIGLYFSAEWCLPGFKFTPKLISIYQKIKQLLVESKDEDFEVVLVSSDRNQIAFNSYFGTMPWLALPFGDPTIKSLTKYFDVQGIPSLLIVGPDGKTITRQGRNLINLYQEKAYPFTDAKLEFLEKQIDEEAKSLPKSVYHTGHRHELTLVSDGTGGGPFICCDCDEQGSGWAYQCIECGFEVHPKCVKAVNRGSIS
ncbi:hypothetical protein HHK36_002901 [Tetracentron sinense]|uniref:protein-disulfide reductase n=1 Tax=Tetracentron sinense TaxID=13715 RepID=A0A835DNE0_TETSI|nr:hypothetical protein HHK36_002901 [Tetracentron sinense]